MKDEFPTPIQLRDQLGELHDPVPLFTGPVEIYRDGNLEMVGDVVIELDWLPSLQTTFRFSSSRLDFPSDGAIEIRGIPGVPHLKGLTTGMTFDAQPAVSGIVTGAADPECELAELRFGVTNLRPFIGAPLTARIVNSDGKPIRATWAGRIELSDGDWKLKIDERHGAGELVQTLKAAGGIAITHTASLTRAEGKSFNVSEAREMLGAIRGFLALVRGAWAAPVLAVGTDTFGAEAWRDWGPPTSDRWFGARSAFDVHHPQEYQSAFAGYLSRWKDPNWNEPLRYATHMYVEANSGITLDTTLFLCQTILELVAWVLFVEEQQTRSENDFDDRKASERIRELLAWLQIDSTIPSNLSKLVRSCAALGWTDGPHALTSMRNALAHPRIRERLSKPPISARIELHELALWYVELALLRLIGFDGNYSNRLSAHNVGEVERVPWAAAM